MLLIGHAVEGEWIVMGTVTPVRALIQDAFQSPLVPCALHEHIGGLSQLYRYCKNQYRSIFNL